MKRKGLIIKFFRYETVTKDEKIVKLLLTRSYWLLLTLLFEKAVFCCFSLPLEALPGILVSWLFEHSKYDMCMNTHYINSSLFNAICSNIFGQRVFCKYSSLYLKHSDSLLLYNKESNVCLLHEQSLWPAMAQ